jgi:triosephosphate isomerase
LTFFLAVENFSLPFHVAHQILLFSSMRKKLVAANWKMNLTLQQVQGFTEELNFDHSNFKCDVQVYAPSIYLAYLLNRNVPVGAQNFYFQSSGAFTGEISCDQLKSIGCNHVLVGHSERRILFDETNDIIRKKLETAFKSEMNPILCIGESLEIRENNAHLKFIENQLKAALNTCSISDLGRLTIAYEPVWAIGTGHTANASQVAEMHAFIRQFFAKEYGDTLSDSIRILYGGSCNEQNAKELFSLENVDGGLIGGASLSSVKFLQILNIANELS